MDSTHSTASFPFSLDPEHFGEISSLPLLLLSLLPIENVEAGIFSRITMTSMTGAWYLKLTHFEAIMVGLIVLQIFVMSYLLILPLDITKLIEDGTLLSTSVSRKKRALNYSEVAEQQRVAETMFAILRRVDEDDCLLRTLCELEFSRNGGAVYPNGLSSLLGGLKRLGHKRIKREMLIVPNNITIVERKVLSDFEDAVLYGAGSNSIICENEFRNNSCAMQYSLCTVETSKLMEYVRRIEPFLG